jgi:hypothetical protein
LTTALWEAGIDTVGPVTTHASTRGGRPVIVVNVVGSRLALEVFHRVVAKFPGEPQFIPDFETPEEVGKATSKAP